MNEVQQLSEMAHSQPQAAYLSMIKSLQLEWNHLQGVVPNCKQHYSDLKYVLAMQVLPAGLGGDIITAECLLISLLAYTVPGRPGSFHSPPNHQ